MKIIDKTKIKEKNLLHTNRLENDIYPKKCPFLVPVYNVFQNARKVYLVMEYVETGDLCFYLYC